MICEEDGDKDNGDDESENSEDKETTETAGALLPIRKEPCLAMTADLFDKTQYWHGKRRAEWEHIKNKGEATADAWQDLKVCRCHGQCGALNHTNRRLKPCQNEGTVKCRDTTKGFSFHLCRYCVCSACRKQQGCDGNQGMCFSCAGGKSGETVPVSKRPAAANAFFDSTKRRKILQSPAA